jgi:hypothetical protein
MKSHAEGDNDNAIFEKLNFFERTDETMSDICRAASAIEVANDIKLKDSLCEDIIPYILIDALVRGANITEPAIQVESTGLSKAIRGLELKHLCNHCLETDNGEVWPFPVVYGRSHSRDLEDPNIVTEIWSAVNGYLETLDSWLEQHGFKMVSKFMTQMESHILELIGNADHALLDSSDNTGGDWAISGYMARRGKNEYICYVTLITLGKTIFQSLSEHPNLVVKDYLEKYVAHKDASEKLSEEALVTAAATHDTVSSRQAGGGNGLTDFLHGFTNATAASHKDLRSFVISGHGHVLFFGDYKKTNVTPEGRIRQTFNPEDSIYVPPDTSHVYHSERGFPGTIIGVRFYLDEEDLLARLNGMDEN